MDVTTTKADELRQLLEELIVAGQLTPGTVLRQDDLARRFSVSRTPVREALCQLAAMGLVRLTPNRGVRVEALDRDEWTQTYRARAALEGAAAELAAAAMTPETLARLEEAEDDFACHTQQLRKPSLDAKGRTAASYDWVGANDRFHAEILAAADVPVIERLIHGLRRVFSGQAVWSPGSAADALYESTLRQHAAIRAALAAGDGQAARLLMERHILESWQTMQAVLDDGERLTATDLGPVRSGRTA